jgi:hypothetical protein
MKFYPSLLSYQQSFARFFRGRAIRTRATFYIFWHQKITWSLTLTKKLAGIRIIVCGKSTVVALMALVLRNKGYKV